MIDNLVWVRNSFANWMLCHNFCLEICIDGTKHLFKLNEIKLFNKIDYSDKNRIYSVIIIL